MNTEKIKLTRIEIIDIAWWYIDQKINPEECEQVRRIYDERSFNELIEKYKEIVNELK
jgi:uncharacterized membrane protein